MSNVRVGKRWVFTDHSNHLFWQTSACGAEWNGSVILPSLCIQWGVGVAPERNITPGVVRTTGLGMTNVSCLTWDRVFFLLPSFYHTTMDSCNRKGWNTYIHYTRTTSVCVRLVYTSSWFRAATLKGCINSCALIMWARRHGLSTIPASGGICSPCKFTGGTQNSLYREKGKYSAHVWL